MPASRKHDSEELKRAIETSSSIAQALRKVGLAPAGGNYATARRLIDKFSIDTSHINGQGWNINDCAGLLRRKTIPLKEKWSRTQNGGFFLLKRRLLELESTLVV